MPIISFCTRFIGLIFATSALLIVSSCGGGGGGPPPPPPPPTGSIEVILERAPGSSALFFSVLADAGTSFVRATDEARPHLITGLIAGDYVIEASDPTPNCQIQGADQKAAVVIDGETTSVSFSISCTFTPTSRIAFQTDPEDTSLARIWTIRPDGTELQQVSSGFGIIPFWSPDGSRIAYLGTAGIWMANYDGSEDREFVGIDGFRATWSPDGAELVVRTGSSAPGQPGGAPDLWRVNADGSNGVRITDDPAAEETPAWSPDGSMIAIVKNNDFQLIDTNGSFLLSLGHAWDESWPRWSPDGSKLVFAWNEPGQQPEWQIYTVNVDGSNRTQLTFMDTPCGAPAFSPDGTEIIFHCPRITNEFMWRMNVDGTNQRIFAEIPGPDVAHGDWVGP